LCCPGATIPVGCVLQETIHRIPLVGKKYEAAAALRARDGQPKPRDGRWRTAAVTEIHCRDSAGLLPAPGPITEMCGRRLPSPRFLWMWPKRPDLGDGSASRRAMVLSPVAARQYRGPREATWSIRGREQNSAADGRAQFRKPGQSVLCHPARLWD